MGLGDHLVTIRGLGRPWGPTEWPLGPSSPSHGPPKSLQIAICRWFNGIWCVHKQFSSLYKSKMENFAYHFFDVLTTHNDQICCLKHGLDPLCVLCHPVWVLGGGPKGAGAQPACAVFQPLVAQKMEISETDFFDTLTIHNDQISYVKHVLDPLHVFFTLFGCCGGTGGGLPRGPGHNMLMQFSSLGTSKMVVPLSSSKCLAKGNRNFSGYNEVAAERSGLGPHA